MDNIYDLNGVIAAVEDIKQYKQFLKSKFNICVIMNIHISMLDMIFREAKEYNKQVLVHIDLIHGLANDEYGAEFLCQRYNPLGVISIKPAVVAACKRLKTIAVQRVFLIDSAALKKSINSVRQTMPDYVEILPAMCSTLFPMLKRELDRPLIAGGLIPSLNDALGILDNGISAVTINISRLIEETNNNI